MAFAKLNVVSVVEEKEVVKPQIFFDHSFESSPAPFVAEKSSARSFFRYKNLGTVLVQETVEEIETALLKSILPPNDDAESASAQS